MASGYYQNLVREILVTPPTSQSRTLYIEGVPKSWPCADRPGHKGTWSACFFLAKYALRAALENGCVYIEVRKGPHHKHRFDVGDLLKTVKMELGGKLPRPRYHPSLLNRIATMRHKSKGGTFDATRLVIPVHASISAAGRLKGESNGN